MLLCVVMLAGWPTSAACANSGEAPALTVAVVADRGSIDAGIPDLLTLELAQVEGVQTVERSDIRRLLREQMLTAALAPAGSSRRLELGQLLKADWLVLLRLIRSGREQFLSCTISETVVGARLRTEILPVGNRDPDRVATECRDIFEQTRDHFRNGIHRLIGVLPFASNNLVHDFDALQSAYPTLLQSALMRVPGVAVLEIDEAHSIRRELDVTAKDLRRRHLPLFVVGEYSVDRDDGTVSLLVSLQDGEGERKRVEHDGLSRDAAVELLTGSLVSELLEVADSDSLQPLSRRAQFDVLADRASRLSGIGEYAMALPLREAALLVTPDSFSQRVHTLYDFTMVWTTGPYANWKQDNKPPEDVDAAVEEWETVVESMHIAYGHLEYLIANRMINLREAATLLAPMNLRMSKVRQAKHPVTGQYGYDVWKEYFWRMIERCIELDPELRNGRVHPLIWRMPGHGNSEPSDEWSHQAQFELFWAHAGWLALAQPAVTPPEGLAWPAWRLERLRRLMPILARQPLMSAAMINRFGHLDRSPFRPTSWFFSNMLSAEEHTQAFRDAAQGFVAQGGKAGLYGAWLLLGLDLQAGVKEEAFDAMRRRAQALGDQTLRHIEPVTYDEGRDVDEFPEHLAIVVRRHVNDTTAGRPGIPNVPGRPPPLSGKRHRAPMNPIPPRDPNQRVTFHRRDIASMWTGMLKCTDQLDVYWNPLQVEIMTAPGQLRTIYRRTRPDSQIADVLWDGEQFWIVTASAGIHILAPDGQPLGVLLPDARVTPGDDGVAVETGSTTRIPPYNAGQQRPLIPGRELELFLSRTNFAGTLRVYPVEPGRCIAWGRYGPKGRLWFAEISFTAGRREPFQVRVFHTATRLAPRRPTPEEDRDIHLIFQPAWHREMTLDGRRLLLIGRLDPPGQGTVDLIVG
jgi:hypothetical protein